MSSTNRGKTSSGLDENVAGLCCYVLWAITGIIFLLIEKENRFVRFHALQSIFVTIVIVAINFLLTIIPFLGVLLSIPFAIACFALWIFMMVKAFQGTYFKLPFIGDLVEKQLQS